MKNEDKIVELLSEMVIESQKTRAEVVEMKNEISGVKGEISGVKGEISGMRKDISELKRGQERNTAAVGELRLSVMKLADEIGKMANHESRISKLEATVFH